MNIVERICVNHGHCLIKKWVLLIRVHRHVKTARALSKLPPVLMDFNHLIGLIGTDLTDRYHYNVAEEKLPNKILG